MDLDKQILTIASIMGESKKKPKAKKAAPPKHVWSQDEELLAIQLYQSKASLTEIKKAIAETKIKLPSMRKKIQNIQFLDTGVGLENVSPITKQLWEKHK